MQKFAERLSGIVVPLVAYTVDQLQIERDIIHGPLASPDRQIFEQNWLKSHDTQSWNITG